MENLRLREVEQSCQSLQLGFESPLDSEPRLFASARDVPCGVPGQNQETVWGQVGTPPPSPSLTGRSQHLGPTSVSRPETGNAAPSKVFSRPEGLGGPTAWTRMLRLREDHNVPPLSACPPSLVPAG